ncbi:CarD family transcriptional regulator [Virgibacillus sediminis]|uniref:CarD family transcriptional regulator n=1 Tax=Virgibacillus sediminis TaxID=202260 RepID=A0ABV7A768_9BACI
MFNVGDVIIYSVHGLSKIDDICDKTYGDVTRSYYVLHPLEDPKLTINTPVDNERVVMLAVMEKEEAEEILQSFQQPGIQWIEDVRQRRQTYRKLVNSGDRREIAKVVNTLIRRKREAEREHKKLLDQDRHLLANTQNIMFKELAVALRISAEEVADEVNRMIE